MVRRNKFGAYGSLADDDCRRAFGAWRQSFQNQMILGFTPCGTAYSERCSDKASVDCGLCGCPRLKRQRHHGSAKRHFEPLCALTARRRTVDAGLPWILRKNPVDLAAHDVVAVASRPFGRSISIRPLRSDRIALDARSLRTTSVTVVRRTPSNCASASRVSGMALLSIRSRMWSNHRAIRASTGCSALQAARCWN